MPCRSLAAAARVQILTKKEDHRIRDGLQSIMLGTQTGAFHFGQLYRRLAKEHELLSCPETLHVRMREPCR